MPRHPPSHRLAKPRPASKQEAEKGQGCRILATAWGGGARWGQLKDQLMIQKIPDVTGRVCTVLWDTGAQTSLVTQQYAREAGFKGRTASIQISGVGTGNKNRSKAQYRVLLRKRDGGVAEFTPYGVGKITGDAVGIDLDKAKRLFPAVANSLESPDGPVHMLVGMDHIKDAPREQARGKVTCCINLSLALGTWRVGT
jgi:hypothetical protein